MIDPEKYLSRGDKTLTMRFRHILLALCIIFSFLLVPISLPEESTNWKIVFVSDRNGNEDIYVMNANGTNVVQLTDNPASDRSPVWSPDGTKIAFVSNREWNSDIFVMNADGTDVVQLTDSFAEDLNPAWSPDGTRIAFNSDRDGLPQIYVMNADGSTVTRVTNDRDWNAAPVWSPDGNRIAYSSTQISDVLTTGNVASRIRVIELDGSNRRELTAEDDSSPAWSPDGGKIVFDSFRDGNFEIYIMNADGTQQKRLTDHSRIDHFPAWSPDGERIAFASNRDGNFEIYIMDADSSNVVRITENSSRDDQPNWHSQNLLGSGTKPVTTPHPTEATPPHPDTSVVPPVEVVVPPHSTKSGISWIKISYELRGSHGTHWEYWIARHADGDYYIDTASGIGLFSRSPESGRKVDIARIQALAESLTDFYSTDKILRLEGTRLDGSVNFDVVMKLENGKSLSMNTPPDYGGCCLIPWSIEYKDKKYMQSNGRISEAVLRLLNELGDDEELQVLYDKEIRWGCYPAVLHYKPCDEELSDDFPRSTPAVAPAEKLGEQHVLWEVDIAGAVCPSVYANGLIYLATNGHITAISADTRQKIWDVEVEDYKDREETLIVRRGMIYAAVPPCVYCINSLTGDRVWKYTSSYNGSLRIIPMEEKLIIWEKTKWIEGRMYCLDAKSGDHLWELPDDLCFLGLAEDAILCKIEKGYGDEYLYILIDSNSGEQIWQKDSSEFVHWDSDIMNWSYAEGVLYMDKETEGTVIALDMETMEEHVLYSHRKFRSEYEPGELVQYCQVFEEGILLSLIELGETEGIMSRWNTHVVFLERTGKKLWDHHYDEKSVGSICLLSGLFYWRFVYNPVQRAEINGNTLYLVRQGGFIEAFDVVNGGKMWESEVRDSVQNFFIRGNRMYIAAEDCTVYCLDIRDGEIVWELRVCDNHCIVNIVEADSFLLWPSCMCGHLVGAVAIGNEMLLVTTEDRLIAVSISADAQKEEECPPILLSIL